MTKSTGGLDVAGILGEAFNGILSSAAEANTASGAAAYTGLIEDVKRAHNSGDSNALVKLGATLLGVYLAGEVANSLIENKAKKELGNGKNS